MADFVSQITAISFASEIVVFPMRHTNPNNTKITAKNLFISTSIPISRFKIASDLLDYCGFIDVNAKSNHSSKDHLAASSRAFPASCKRTQSPLGSQNMDSAGLDLTYPGPTKISSSGGLVDICPFYCPRSLAHTDPE